VRSTLEVLDFHTTIKDTNSHHCQEVVSSVRVVVDTSEEGSRGVGSDSPLDQVSTTWVVLGERRAVVDESVDGHERSLFGLGLEVVPRDDREVVTRLGPVQLLALLLQLDELHGVLTLLDLVVGESLEVGSEAESRSSPDEPLGGVVLVPLDGVSEVHGELVVEVVVTLSDGAKSGEEVVARRVLVVEWLVFEPVGQRVDAKGRVVDKDKSGSSGEEESTFPVTPAETSDKGGDNEAKGEEEGEVVSVLPSNDLVSRQVGDVGDSDLASWLDDHPSDVSPPEALVGRVWVELGVGVSVVSSVSPGPPFDGTLDGTGTSHGEEVLQRSRGIVRSVCPQSVVTSSDTETSDEIVHNGPDCGLGVPARREHSVDGNTRCHRDGEEGNPLDVP